jgi:transcriptional regulator with XRE-family HTH domain
MGMLDEEREYNSEEIKAIRTALGATQERFANKLGVSFATVSRWESGLGPPSRLAQVVLRGIVSQYGLTIDKMTAPERDQAAPAKATRRGRTKGGRTSSESTSAADES